MTTNPHELYRRWIDELWNGDLLAASDVVAQDFVGHWPDRDIAGPEELAAAIGEVHEMFDDLRFSIAVGPIADGDLVAGRWVGTGEGHGGAVTFTGNDVLRVADGRFVEYWQASSAGA